MRSLITVIVLVAFSGCSLIGTTGPDRPDDPSVYPDCTDSMVLPWLDGLTALSVLAPDYGGSSKDEDTFKLVVLGVYGLSWFVGRSRVKSCRHARRAYVAAHPTLVLPQPLLSPPPASPPVLTPPHGPVPAQ